MFGFWIIGSNLANQKQASLTATSRDLTINTSILAYLRSPFEGSTVAEAMARAAVTGDFAALHPNIQAFLETLPKPGSGSGWRYRIALLPEEQELDDLETMDIIGWYEAKHSSFIIPSYDPTHMLRMTFALECQDVSCHD